MIDVGRLWASEWIACGFLAYLSLVAVGRRLGRLGAVDRALDGIPVEPVEPGPRAFQVVGVSVVVTTTVVSLAQLEPAPAVHAARAWLPALYLLLGYWSSGLAGGALRPAVERWLADVDERLGAAEIIDALAARGASPLLGYLELAYLTAYAFVPASFAIVFFGLEPRQDADAFWVAVLSAGFVCYGMLPWLRTRPPRELEADRAPARRRSRLRRINLAVLGHASVGVNTLPSGHAATTVAAALAVLEVHPTAGLACLWVAISIVVATVVGRYHYVVDSVVGSLIGLAAWHLAFG